MGKWEGLVQVSWEVMGGVRYIGQKFSLMQTAGDTSSLIFKLAVKGKMFTKCMEGVGRAADWRGWEELQILQKLMKVRVTVRSNGFMVIG